MNLFRPTLRWPGQAAGSTSGMPRQRTARRESLPIEANPRSGASRIAGRLWSIHAGGNGAVGRGIGCRPWAPANPQDNMADQSNAQSLSRARPGTDTPIPAVDSTGKLNRMSQGDAAKGKAMPQPAMPFR
jgi:hypothetical protein